MEEAEFDCLSGPAFDHVMLLKERVRTLEEIIRSTH